MATKGSTPLPAGKEITLRYSAQLDEAPDAVYDVIADVPSHLEWAGNQVKKKFRLTALEGGLSPAQSGTEWSSSGLAPDGTFKDRSVVTEASRPRAFEFKTDSHVTFKNGNEADWSLINRYDVEPSGSGSKVTFTQRMTGASDLGSAKMLMSPIMGPIARMMIGGMVKPALKNLGALAAQRGPRSG